MTYVYDMNLISGEKNTCVSAYIILKRAYTKIIIITN